MELVGKATKALYSLIGNARKYDLPVDIQTELLNTSIQNHEQGDLILSLERTVSRRKEEIQTQEGDSRADQWKG